MIHKIEHAPVNPTFEYADSYVVPEGTTELVAQGGGSTIDVGKWVAYKENLPLTAIPTTAGTGSEVTSYCVLTIHGTKKTFHTNKPDKYILDPALVVSLPKEHTLASGLDAFSQALEALWSRNRTEESTRYAQMAFDLIPRNLKLSIDEPDNLEARMNMLIAAHFSGRAIEITKTNVCHAISYPLTDMFDIPHGIACAMSLPYFAKKYLNIDIKGFIDGLDIPKQKFDIEAVLMEVDGSPKLNDTPVKVTEIDIKSSLGVL